MRFGLAAVCECYRVVFGWQAEPGADPRAENIGPSAPGGQLLHLRAAESTTHARIRWRRYRPELDLKQVQ